MCFKNFENLPKFCMKFYSVKNNWVSVRMNEIFKNGRYVYTKNDKNLRK